MSKFGKLYLILALLSLLLFAMTRFLFGEWVPFLYLCLGGLILFLGLTIWQDRVFYREFFAMKTTKHGMSMGGMILSVLVLLIAVNFIAVRKYKTFDFSAAKLNTLSPQSVQLVQGLKADLHVIYFYEKGQQGVEENRHAFIELMKKYQDQSDHVKLDFVDVNERPDMTEKYGVTKGNGVVFLDYQERRSQIQKIDEQEITSALVKVTRDSNKVVYLLSGHGELDTEDGTTPAGAQFLKQMLEQSRYTVKLLTLVNQEEIPKDADVVIALGPQQAYLENELKALDGYLARGGGLILGLKSHTKSNLKPWLAKYGVLPQENYVVNILQTPMGKGINPKVTTGSHFSTGNSITKPFGKNEFVVFHLPEEIKVADKMPEGLRAEALVETGEDAMVSPDLNFKTLGKTGVFPLVQFITSTASMGNSTEKNTDKSTDKNTDKKETAPDLRLVVMGDAEAFSNQNIYQNLNRDLVLNSVAFLSREETLISITPKEVGITHMQLTQTNFVLFIFGFIILLPVALLSTSVTLWFKRRYA